MDVWSMWTPRIKHFSLERLYVNQFLARVYEILQINPNQYNMTIKKIWGLVTQSIIHVHYLLTYLMMKWSRLCYILASNMVNYGCIPIFVTTSPSVPNQDLKPFVEIET